jgi:hypothetical protein
MTKNKNAIMIALFLMFTVAVSLFALPSVNAQSDLVMNIGDTKAVVHGVVDIDLNGGPGPFENVSLFVKYPGDSSFTFIDTYETRSNGDLDVYSNQAPYPDIFNVLGVFELKWAYPVDSPYYPGESNVDVVTVVTRIERSTYCYIGALPNPVGVGQPVLFHVGITQQLSRIGMEWEDLSITIERPDGKTDTLSNINTDSTGGTGRNYVPNIAGNYTIQGHYPEQQTTAEKSTPGSGVGTWMLASDSPLLTLVVQEEPLQYYPGHPLPTEYWTRPIDSQLREWYVEADSWLVSTPENKFVPGNEGAPDTAHVLWAKPLITGGLVGGDIGLESSINQGAVGYETGDAYQGKWTSRFIIAGMVIYTHHTSIRPLVYTAVDVRTGEELWQTTFLDNRSISMCQNFYWESYNYMGTYRYIWVTVGSTWYAFDPFDLQLRLTITNVPSGTTVVGERGEIYRYSISTSQDRVQVWNMSALISMEGSFRSPNTGTYDAGGSNPTSNSQLRAYTMNFTIPEDYSGSTLGIWPGDRVVAGSISNEDGVRLCGFSLEPGNEGAFLFDNTWDAPAYWAEGDLTISGFGGGWVAHSQEDHVSVMWIKETQEHYGFSLETGKYLWGPTPSQYYLDSVDDSASDVRLIAYGRLYSASVGGICYCYNVSTGDLLWTYEARDPYHDYLMANTWWLKPTFITDGKIYLGHAEHSANQPLPRGAPFICLNASTGEVIFRVDGMFRQTRWGGRAIIGDSVMVTMDTYDQRIYAVGRGPSAMTVSAPDVGVEYGKTVTVRGTVTDVSPGTNDIKLTTRFPNGVPAVSDANQSEWMLHVYKQFELPADVLGVEVVVSVIDPNNNWYEVARTTSDAGGYFGCTFEPAVPGFYKVIATFEGSGAYFGSFAETFVDVEEAPEATAPPTPTPPPMTDTYVLGIGTGAIIAIVVVGLLLYLMLRKR